MITDVCTPQFNTSYKLPLYLSSVPAGFPSPADDYIEKSLDLNEHLVEHPSSTFYVRVKGHSMINAGIFSNDILIVDRSISSFQNRIVVAILDGDFTVKRFKRVASRVTLMAENPDYPSINLSEDQDFEVWGVVVHVIHNV